MSEFKWHLRQSLCAWQSQICHNNNNNDYTISFEKMTSGDPPTEADALLPKPPQPPSPGEIWRHAKPVDKTLMLCGTMGAIAGGCANGLTYALYGRLLDAMARVTLDGVDGILVQYGQFAALELAGVWFQYFTWSRAALHRKQSKTMDDSEEGDAEDGYLEALGEVVFNTAAGLMALAVAVRFGWDSLLAIIAVVGLTIIFPWLMIKWITRRSKDKSGGKETAMTKAEEDKKLLEQEIDELWRHARALKLMDAVGAAKDCVHKLISTKHKSVRGMMVGFMIVLFAPVIIALVYTAWKITKDTSSGSGAFLAVVFLASWRGVTSLQQAWTTFSKGDWSIEKSKKRLPFQTKSAEVVAEADKYRAHEWLRSITKSSGWETALVWSVLAAKTAMYLTAAVALGSSFAWLLQAPYTGQTPLVGVWKYVLGLVLVGVGLGLTFEASIAVQGKVCNKAHQTVFLQAFVARLQVEDATTTGKTLVEDSTQVVMYTMGFVDPPNAGMVATCSLALILGLWVDPKFTVATLVATPVSFLPYAFFMKRDKALYRCFFDTTVWLVGVIESFFRACIHIVPRVAEIVMAYVQTQWIFSGSSTLYSILVVESLSMICFGVSHTSRFGLGFFIRDEALAAAARLQACIEKAEQVSFLQPHTIDEGVASSQLKGELCINGSFNGVATHKRVRDGELAVLASENAEVFRSLSQNLLRLDALTSVSATVAGVDIATLPLAVVRSSVMVVDADPVRFPGTLRDNICVGIPTPPQLDVEQAVRLAELSEGDLDEELTLDKWVSGPNAEQLKHGVVTARALLRKPDVLIVEDFHTSGGGVAVDKSIDLAATVATIRRAIPRCKVLVATVMKKAWDERE